MPLRTLKVYEFSHIKYQYGLSGFISNHLAGSYGMDYMNRFIQKHLLR